MESIICPKRGQKTVDLTMCVGICELKDECNEFMEVPQSDIDKALAKLNEVNHGSAGFQMLSAEQEEDVISEDKEMMEEPGLLLTKALTLRHEIEMRFWELGEILYKIFANQYYIEYGYVSWQEFCNEVLDIRWRTATYLKDIYAKFSELGVKPEEIVDIGWVRLKELLPVVDKKNVKEWIREAKNRKTTLRQLNARVKFALGKITQDELEKPIRVVSFSLHEEQEKNVNRALEIAMKITGSKIRGYLLEMVCAEFRATYEASGDSKSRLEIADEILGRLEKTLSVEFRGELIDVRTGEFIKKA